MAEALSHLDARLKSPITMIRKHNAENRRLRSVDARVAGTFSRLFGCLLLILIFLSVLGT